jgi:hypothetical protein
MSTADDRWLRLRGICIRRADRCTAPVRAHDTRAAKAEPGCTRRIAHPRGASDTARLAGSHAGGAAGCRDIQQSGAQFWYAANAGSIDINAMMITGDIALVPYGNPGPAVAALGYDLHHLDVIACPDAEKIWLIGDEPAHAWVRETCRWQEIFARLPCTAGRIALPEYIITSDKKGRH